MTTTDVEVKELPKPGTIIFVQGSIDTRDSLFGLTTSIEFFRENASERIVSSFDDHRFRPKHDVFIPAFVMLPDFSWVIRFRQRHHSVLFDSLLDADEVLGECLKRMSCFTYRDGSRYYAFFIEHLRCYLGFLSGVKKIEDFSYFTRENPLERKFLEHLMKWREKQKPKPESTDEVMRKTLELAREQLGNYKKGTILSKP